MSAEIPGYLAIVIGHTRRRPGAFGVEPISENEYFYNTDLGEIIKTLGAERGHTVELFFRDGVGIEGAYDQVEEWEADAVIELHFNAFNNRVKGTETLYSDESDDKQVFEKVFAEFVQEEMCRVFDRQGRENRGLRNRAYSRGERGYKNVNQVFNAPSILVEPFFGDNPEDAQMAVDKKTDLAEAMIIGFEQWKSFIAQERGFIERPDTETLNSDTSSNKKKRSK